MMKFIFFYLIACTMFIINNYVYADEELFSIDSYSDYDEINIEETEDGVVIEIYPATGIGHATLTNNYPEWPQQLILRIYTPILEGFVLENANAYYSGSVYCSEDSDEQLLFCDSYDSYDQSSPYWIDIACKRVSGQAELEYSRYFEMELPQIIFEGNVPDLYIEWVDFYRY